LMFLLDTNVVSELRKAGTARIDPHVLTWASAQRSSDLYLSAISILEIEIGILQLERKDVHQASVLRTWMNDHVLPAFEGRILPVDVQVALACAAMHIPDRRSERDALIAATAAVHKLTVITRNLHDFRTTGVKLLNPWEPQAPA